MQTVRRFFGFMMAAGVTVGFDGLLALDGGRAQTQTADPAAKHFDPKGNPQSMYTIESRKGVSAMLPFGPRS